MPNPNYTRSLPDTYSQVIDRRSLSTLIFKQFERSFRLRDQGGPFAVAEVGYDAVETAVEVDSLVVSDGTALRGIYKDGKNAFVASIGPNVDDTEYFTASLTEALDRALTASPSRKKKMIAANRRFIRTDFSVDTMVRGYLHIMRAMTA